MGDNIWKRNKLLGEPYLSYHGLSYSPDRKLMLARNPSVAYIWESASGKQVKSFRHKSYQVIYSTAFSPNGKYLVTGGSDGIGKLWELASRQQIYTLGVSSHWQPHLAISGEGDEILTSSPTPDALLVNRNTGETLLRLQGHQDQVTATAFFPNHPLLLTGSADHTVKLWDRESGQEIQTCSGHIDTVSSLAASPDGQVIMAGFRDGHISLWRIADSTVLQLRPAHDTLITAVVFTPDSKQFISADEKGVVVIWNKNGSIYHTYNLGYPVRNINFSADGKDILLG